MKKILTGILALLTVFACATACKKPGKDSGSESSNVSESVSDSVDESVDESSSDVASESSSDVAEDELADAAAYLEELYKNKDVETRQDYEILPAIWGFNITWSVDVTEGVSIENVDGKVIVNVDEMLDADLPYVLTASVADESGRTVVVSFSRTVLAAPSIIPVAITEAPVEGTAYKYHVYQSTLATDMYFAGGMAATYYFSTTTDSAEAVDVYVEYVEGSTTEFYPYFNHVTDGKQYIGVRVSDDGAHDNIVYTSAPTAVFTWNENLGTITAHLEATKNNGGPNDFYLGNYGDKTTISASYTSRAGEAGNNVGHLVTLVDRNSITPETKVAESKEGLLLNKTDFIGAAEFDLPTARHEDVKVDWTVSENAYASISNGKLVIVAPEAETTVTLTATLSCGEVSDTKEFTITLKPMPTLDTPAAIVDAAYDLPVGEALPGTHTLTGIITKIDTPYSAQYSNVSVIIVVENKDDKPILCFRLKGDGADVIKAGDTITVTGTLKNYNNTIEFDAGCTLDSYTVGEGTPDDSSSEEGGDVDTTPEYTVMSISDAVAAADGTNVQVSGTVCAINTAWSDSYKNISVTIEDENGNSLYLYRLATNVALGDIITVKGTMATYNNARQIAAGATAEITDHDASYDYVELSIAEAIKAADNTNVIVTGTVVKIGTAYSSQYNNISVYIADENGTQLYLYRLSGDVALNTIIKVKGSMATYNGNRQLAGGTFESVGTHSCENYTDATCSKPASCIVCGTAKDDITLDHTYADATCTLPATCTVCGATNGEALGHTTENGTCERCNEVIGGEAEVVAQYVKVTSASEFTTGTYVLIVDTKNITVSTIDGTWLKGSSLSAGDTIDKTEGDALAITLEVSDSGVKIKIGDQYVKPKGGNNNGISTGDYTWAYEFQADGTIVFSGVGSDTVYLAYNVSNDGFRGYKTTTVDGNNAGYPHFFTAYKLVG